MKMNLFINFQTLKNNEVFFIGFKVDIFNIFLTNKV